MATTNSNSRERNKESKTEGERNKESKTSGEVAQWYSMSFETFPHIHKSHY